MAEPVELPSRLAILPFRNKVLLPGAVIRIRCTSPRSVKLVEQELWQREEKGLIGVLPVRDAEASAVGSLLSPGAGNDATEKASADVVGDSQKQCAKNQQELVQWHNRRLWKMQSQQPGYSSSRVYIELLTDLPWQKVTEELEIDLKAAKKRLDYDHYGLHKVKQRIIEYLAVLKLKPDARGPVLCFVGPPGVGKTSLASSIAAALNRKFIRISLGGVKDEADIRGHRRTYIGSMPGRLIEGVKT